MITLFFEQSKTSHSKQVGRDYTHKYRMGKNKNKVTICTGTFSRSNPHTIPNSKHDANNEYGYDGFILALRLRLGLGLELCM